MDDFVLEYGSLGTYSKTNIFQWNEDHADTHEVHNCASYLNSGDSFYFEWNYDTDGYTYLWYWVIDDAYVWDGDGDLIPVEPFDSFPPTDWYVDDHGEPGTWEGDTDHQPTTGGTPPNAQADSDGNYGDTFDTSLFSPTVYTEDGDGTVTVEFFSEYQNYAGYDYASFYLWWEEYIVGVESASLGEIKATFK